MLIRDISSWPTNRNHLCNTVFAGAASGVPGTPGRGHTTFYPDGGNGITVLINGVGLEVGPSGIYEYLEWRVFGTPIVDGASYYFVSNFGFGGTKTDGPFDGWPQMGPYGGTLSMEIKRVANGTLPTSMGIGWNEQTSGFLINGPVQTYVPQPNYTVVQFSAVPDYRTEWNEPFFYMRYSAGVNFDTAIRVARIQLERGLTRSPYERRLTI